MFISSKVKNATSALALTPKTSCFPHSCCFFGGFLLALSCGVVAARRGGVTVVSPRPEGAPGGSIPTLLPNNRHVSTPQKTHESRHPAPLLPRPWPPSRAVQLDAGTRVSINTRCGDAFCREEGWVWVLPRMHCVVGLCFRFFKGAAGCESPIWRPSCWVLW